MPNLGNAKKKYRFVELAYTPFGTFESVVFECVALCVAIDCKECKK